MRNRDNNGVASRHRKSALATRQSGYGKRHRSGARRLAMEDDAQHHD